MSVSTRDYIHVRGAVLAEAAIARGLAPCGRCMVVHRTEGQLAAHLVHEHLMPEYQARREAQEAATGIARDEDGLCCGCHHASGQAHAPACYVARRAERRGYRR